MNKTNAYLLITGAAFVLNLIFNFAPEGSTFHSIILGTFIMAVFCDIIKDAVADGIKEAFDDTVFVSKISNLVNK